jgi:hypothetical protein
MFPNVRLMIVAMVVSIAASGGGLGAFAAFRVNHEPFARLPSDNPPLQLVYYNAASPSVTDATPAPFGVRFQLGAPQIAPAAADLAMLERAAAASSPPASPRGLETEPTPAPAVSDTAAAATPLPDAQDSNVGRDAKTGGAPVAAIEPPVDRAVSTDPAAPDAEAAPVVTTPTAAKTTEKTDHRPSRRHRLAATIRPPRKAQAGAIALVTDQNSGLSQFNFQPAPNAFQQQPVKSRRIVRAVATKTAANGAIGGPFVRPRTP